jgi:hypothetical protein
VFIVAIVLHILTGCSGVPGQIVVSHADLAGTDHLARVEADPDTPEAVKETWRQHWAAIRAAGESAGE